MRFGMYLICFVIPATLIDTFMLLFGVGFLTILIGTGSAWIVTAYQFRGRSILIGRCFLPSGSTDLILSLIAISTFSTLSDGSKSVKGWSRLDMQQLWFPNIRSVFGRHFFTKLRTLSVCVFKHWCHVFNAIG